MWCINKSDLTDQITQYGYFPTLWPLLSQVLETEANPVSACCVPSQNRSEDYLALFDSSSDGRKKLASLSKTSPERTTWNVLVLSTKHTLTFMLLFWRASELWHGAEELACKGWAQSNPWNKQTFYVWVLLQLSFTRRGRNVVAVVAGASGERHDDQTLLLVLFLCYSLVNVMSELFSGELSKTRTLQKQNISRWFLSPSSHRWTRVQHVPPALGWTPAVWTAHFIHVKTAVRY